MEERYQKYCYGCGAELQTEDSKKAGYLPKEVIEKRKDGELLCQRCFKLQHYGMMLETPIANEEFKKILKKAGDNKCLLVYVIDIFNFSGSIIEGLEEYTKDNPILIAINKCDILPKSVGLNKIMNWVKNQLEHYGIRYEDVFLVSSIKGQEIDALYSKIVEMSNNKDVYVIGNANVGKSSLLNEIDENFKLQTGEVSDKIKRGKHTTRHAELLKLECGGMVADTPGFSSLTLDDIDEDELKEYFIEFYEHDDCKFGSRCIHENEPSCAVKEAVENGEISKKRYDSYIQLLNEIRQSKMGKRRY